MEWGQFSANFSTLSVEELIIPVDYEVGLFFAAVAENGDAIRSQYVVISPVTKEPITEQYISMLARKALSGVGLEDVKLSELRSDFILKQMETNTLDCVSQITGLQYFTLRTLYPPLFQQMTESPAVSTIKAQ